MVRQYPYQLFVFTAGESVFDESTGEWSSAPDQWKLKSKCRDEAGTGRKITTPDGESYVFGTLVQLPKGTDGIKSGDRIRVMDGAEKRFEGTVVRFNKGQLHSQIWV